MCECVRVCVNVCVCVVCFVKQSLAIGRVWCADIQLDLFSLLPEFDREVLCVVCVQTHCADHSLRIFEGVAELEKLGIVQKTTDARRRVLAAR